MLRAAILAFSETIGRDPLLVQGAGGNISWKDDDTLWIKASGTWLADAREKDIFLPMKLEDTRTLLSAGKSDLTAAVIGDTKLRPSIETSLHTLLPHKIVAHMHAVEVIALAVLEDGRAMLADKLQGVNWMWVDYTKPGAPLAEAIAAAMKDRAAPDVIVLGNHGLIVAGESLEEVQTRLDDILARCRQTERVMPTESNLGEIEEHWSQVGYVLPEDERAHALACDATTRQLAQTHWVMYPDHAVFLGAHATFLAPQDSLPPEAPVCLLFKDRGALVRADSNPGQLAMLSCYLDIAARIADPTKVRSLSGPQIAELLNWDAEKYRQSLNAQK